jgi:acetoin utilization protein AcuB
MAHGTHAISPGGRPHSVRDFMRREFITVSPEDSLREAHQLMQMARLRHLIVVRDGVLAGVLSYRDVQEQALAELENHRGKDRMSLLGAITVGDAMAAPPYFVTPETPIADAAIRLHHLRVGCLPAVEVRPEGARLVGLITESDLLLAAYDAFARAREED